MIRDEKKIWPKKIEYKATHKKCTPIAFFYVQRTWKHDICINCGEKVPNYIQFQVDLMNGK